MAYSLDPAKSVTESVREVALAEIDHARSCLAKSADFHTGVHNARKSLKRLRSLLDLIQPGIPEPLFEHLKSSLSVTAKQLAPARDAQALADTVAKIGKRSPALAGTPTARALHDWLAKRREEAEVRAHADPAARADAALEAMRRMVVNLAIHPDDFAPLAEGLKVTYRAARKAYRKAFEEQNDETLHEWRKEVQRHWRQMQLLTACWPDGLAPRASKLHDLAQLLGDDHDLANLRRLLAMPAMSFGNPNDATAFGKRCRKEQKTLRSEAKLLGSRLFAEKPSAFTERIAAHWRSAVMGTEGRQEETGGHDTMSNVVPFSSRTGDSKLG